jgi:hypothetical protein
MSATGFFRMKKLKGPGKVLVASRHNKRTIQAEQGASGNIDSGRSGLNTCLHGPDSPGDVAQLARTLMAAAGIASHKVNAVLGLELIFSLPTGTAIPLDPYFSECLQWAAANFGGLENVLSADVHRDESAPHMHVLILPLVGGRMNGSAMFGNRQRLLHLHTDFHASVAGLYGLAKAPARLQGRAREQTAQAVIQRLHADNDGAVSSLVWAVLRDVIDRDPVPFAETLGIVAVDPPGRKLRSMAQIFTSKGKGSTKPAKPIGFDSRPKPIGRGRNGKEPPLSCVGDASKPPAPTKPKPPASEGAEYDDSRVIDRSDCEFSEWPD